MSTGRADGGVAVVGVGCRLPGGVDSPESFWRLLATGVDAIGPMPPGRFDTSRFLHPEPGTPGKMVTAEGGFLEGIDRFDAGFFGISPREARKIDPQQRLLLEVAWEALEDAGLSLSALAGRRVGVYVALWTGEYENVMYRSPEDMDFHAITGGGRYAAAGRIAFAFDLRGPTFTVDTGCSGGLVALHLARQALLAGECERAIVGAANLVLQPHVNVGYSRSGMLSAGARCRFGDAGAAGYVRSDGACAMVLERLGRAEVERDPIRGVILGSALNADGQGSGQLATPSREAQAALLRTVYADAGVDPAGVTYVEAHGTGTRAGDPVELGALGEVLGQGRPAERPLLVGSVKTNVGHTEACAGLTGLLKTMLALEHGCVPASLHLREPNPAIPWAELGVAIPRALTPWPADAPALAGVTALGITGTNAHVIVAAPEAVRAPEPVSPVGPQGDGLVATIEPTEREAAPPRLIALSARSPEALQAAAAALRERIAGDGAPALADLSYTTTCRREHHPHRLALVADSVERAAGTLAEYLEKGIAPFLAAGTAPADGAPRLGFVFSGQGSQWRGMGQELMRTAPRFAESIRECDAALRRCVDWSLTAVLAGEGAELDRIDVVQPTLAAVQIALARQLETWGVRPAAVVGHSMGEAAAAHVAGALSLDDAMLVLARRSQLLREIAGKGAMALVDLDPETTTERIRSRATQISVATVNGPRSTVVSGDPEAIDALLAELEAEEVFCRRVRVDVASHSVQCDPLLPRLKEALAGLAPVPAAVPIYSTALARPMGDELLGPEYWVQNLRHAVRLDRAVAAMIADGVDAFVEISPHPILLTSLADIAAESERAPAAIPLLRREEPEHAHLLEAVARLHVLGTDVDWPALADADARLVPLPHYPWQRTRHWVERWEDWSGAPTATAPRWPEEADGWLYRLDWQEVVLPGGEPRPGRWLVVGRQGGPADTLASEWAGAGRAVERGGQGPEPVTREELRALVAGQPLAGVVLLGDLPGAGGEAAARAACEATALLVQELQARPGGAAPMVVLVTVGAQAVASGCPTETGMLEAPLWGFGRVLRDEHPELAVRLIDLDPAGREGVGALLGAVADPGCPERDVVVRGGRALVPRLDRAPRPASVPERAHWPTDGATLITGGLGDLGLAVAKQLVDEGVRRLVLLARTPLPPRSAWPGLDPESADGRKVRAVRELEQRAAVHCASVDVGDAVALEGFLEQWRAEAWPAITAVVHTAGVIDSHLVRSLAPDALACVFRGKVGGALNLDRAFPDARRFLLFSSTSVVIPQAGEANYAAANALLDALAARRRGQGREAQVINWGVWRNAGVIAGDEGARYVEEVRRQGVGSMEPAVAVTVLSGIAASAAGQLFVAPVDWQQLRATRGAEHLGSVFERLVGGAGGEAAAGGGTPLLATLAAAAPGQRRSMLEQALREMVAHILGTEPERLRADATLGSQGLDSLMALEFRNRVEGGLDLNVSATVAWNYPTLTRLAEHLLERIAPTLDGSAAEPTPEPSSPATVPPAEPEPLDAQMAEIAAMSDEDVLRALRRT
jgi:acyl transferase domain-containing protein